MGFIGPAVFALTSLVLWSALAMIFWKAPDARAEEETINFKWAFGALAGLGKDQKFEAITKDAVLKTGDRFKMMVELHKECFVYVIHHNAQGELSMIFPYSPQQFDTDYKVSKRYYVPRGDGWFELDQHLGRETFYLLASGQRLLHLEDLFGQYGSSDAGKKSETANLILDELRILKKQHRELATQAERPLTIGGTIRGIEKAQETTPPDISAISEEIRSSGFVARTFAIEHQ